MGVIIKNVLEKNEQCIHIIFTFVFQNIVLIRIFTD